MSGDTGWDDPFDRGSAVPQGVVRAFAVFALLWAFAYLVWRTLFTLDGADLPASLLLLGAEILAVVVFAARVRSASAAPAAPVDAPDAPLPDTTAVVDATGSSIDELRATLVTLRRVVGLSRIVVVDTDGSRELRTIAERFQVVVVEPSVTVAEAVTGAGTAWVLMMRGGDLIMPDLISICAALCSAPEVGVIQVGVEEANPGSFDTDPEGRWSLDPFERQVVSPSLAARGSIPWLGDTPVMLREAVFPHLEGLTLPADSRRAGVAVAAAGMTVTYLPRTLARIPAPQGLMERLDRRRVHLRSGWAVLGSLRGLSGPARISHLLVAAPFIAALQRLMLVSAAIFVLGFAQVPLRAAAVDLAVIAVPSYLLRWNAHILLGRGRLGPFSVLRGELRTFGVDLFSFRNSRRGSTTARFGLVVAAIVALDAAVIVASVSVWKAWTNQLPGEVAAVALAITAVFLGAAMETVIDAVARRQRRLNHRVRLGLVTCRLEEHDGELVDLSTGGAGVVVPCDIETAPKVGEVTTIAFRIPDAEGAWRNVSALAHVAHRAVDRDGGTRIGVRFDEPTDAPLDPVIEFLTIDRRLVALGRRQLLV